MMSVLPYVAFFALLVVIAALIGRALLWRVVRRRGEALVDFMREGKLRPEACSDAEAYEKAVRAVFSVLLENQDSIPKHIPTFTQIHAQAVAIMFLEELLHNPESVDVLLFDPPSA